MAPVSLCTVAYAIFGASPAVSEVEDGQGLIFDDECDARAPCALELLQRSQLKVSKNARASLVPYSSTLASEFDEISSMIPRIMHQPELSALSYGRDYPEVNEGIWTFDVPREVKVTAWSGQPSMGLKLLSRVAPKCLYNELPHGDEDLTIFHGKKVAAPWAYVIHDNQTDISEYDVVLFYLPYIMRTDWRTSLPATKKEGQLWIATCAEPMFREETVMDCRLANDAGFMQHMDSFASYSPFSEFPTFFDTPSEAQMRLKPPSFSERGNELVTMTISDCMNPERATFLQAFMDEFAAQNKSSAILSYGQCFHNAEEPDKKSCGEKHALDFWVNRCSSRPFKLVAENSLDPWYVSEKVWDAFYEGAIPIYYGTTEAKNLMPPGSVIFAEDYESPAALARAVMDYTEEDIKKAHAWKATPVSEWNRWSEARRNSFVTLLPRICEAVARA